MGVRNKNPKSSVGHSMVDFMVAVLGNTTSNPTIPSDGRFTPTTSTFPRTLNCVSLLAAEAPTRSAQGVFTINYSKDFQPNNVVFANASVLSAGSSPTAVLEATVTIVDPVARLITVKVYVPNGTLTDPGTSDMIVIYCHGQDSGKS
jgi:hypothetical protein